MNRLNSVSQGYIPGKGTFTIVFQEEDSISIRDEVAANPALHQMIQDSRADYQSGNGMTTKQFLRSIAPADFKP